MLHATTLLPLLLSHVDNKLYKIILNGTRQSKRSVLRGRGERGGNGAWLPVGASNRAGVAAAVGGGGSISASLCGSNTFSGS